MATSNFVRRLFRIDEKLLKKVEQRADLVLAYENEMAALTDDELKAKTPYFKEKLANGATVDDILPEAFAVSREAAKRVIGQFPFKVQIMGAIVLHDGDIAEMRTGEGKTLTATMCVYLNALTGRGVHVVTVNEYLASRDAEWMGNIYRFLGLTVGCNLRELTPSQKQEAYKCDITYTTNSEVGFDYLRDNMVIDARQRVLRPLYMAIIDEADSILVDESRTPLIISGGNKVTSGLYMQADRFAKALRSTDYEVDIKSKTVHLTESGMVKAERTFGIKNLYDIKYESLVHHISQAMKANYIMQKDVDYMIKEGAIVIIDQFTGRLLAGRTYSDGLHQAIEAKESVKINPETVTMATITYQNYFRLYEKLAGMTGTAKTEEEEFGEIYNMRVITIPTNRPIQRIDLPDLIYAKKDYKYKAMIEDVKERHAKGQPVLVGTVAVETSEVISDLFSRNGLKHEVLNAKNHAREAEIIARAGEKGAITIATNMAGRGTDIKLGEGVKELGGLYVIGSERHESRRIDGQLRGRSGRQGDPGCSRFYVSLEDELMLRFGNPTMMSMFERSLGEEAIESKMMTKAITSAQKRVEGQNYDTRKSLLDYDDVLRKQRETMYAERDKVIERDDVHDIVKEFFKRVAVRYVKDCVYYVDKDEVVDLDQLEKKFIPQFLTPEEFNKDSLKRLERDDVIDKMIEALVTKEEARGATWGGNIFQMVEKQVLTKVIDTNWTNHIDQMSRLRDGIGLRSYAQTNPLQSYIHEGYDMFNKMMHKIAEQTATYLLNVQVKIEKKEPEQEASDQEAAKN